MLSRYSQVHITHSPSFQSRGEAVETEVTGWIGVQRKSHVLKVK